MAKPLKETLTDIANAIREKDGTTTTMTSQEMPARIEAIPSGGGQTCEMNYKESVVTYSKARQHFANMYGSTPNVTEKVSYSTSDPESKMTVFVLGTVNGDIDLYRIDGLRIKDVPNTFVYLNSAVLSNDSPDYVSFPTHYCGIYYDSANNLYKLAVNFKPAYYKSADWGGSYPPNAECEIYFCKLYSDKLPTNRTVENAFVDLNKVLASNLQLSNETVNGKITTTSKIPNFIPLVFEWIGKHWGIQNDNECYLKYMKYTDSEGWKYAS